MAKCDLFGEVRELKNLKIGFGSQVKVIEHNEFEISGDITIDVEMDTDRYVKQYVEKLRVVYNHDGLLEYVYNESDTPDLFLLIKDVETYVNSSVGSRLHYDGDGFYNEIPLSDNKAIEVYADIYFNF